MALLFEFDEEDRLDDDPEPSCMVGDDEVEDELDEEPEELSEQVMESDDEEVGVEEDDGDAF